MSTGGPGGRFCHPGAKICHAGEFNQIEQDFILISLCTNYQHNKKSYSPDPTSLLQ